VASKKALNDWDYHLFPLLLRWAKRRHPRKSASWITHPYWRTVEQDHWRFATPEGPHLTHHASIPIQRHGKVKGRASPFDGNLLYWARRLQQSHPLTMSRLGALLYKQQGKCRYCGLHFRDGDLIEIDHITPQSQGGKMNAVIWPHCIAIATINAMLHGMVEVFMTRTVLLRSRMSWKLSCPVLEAGRREQSLLPSYHIRYLDMHTLEGMEMVYCISILENFSRAILASAISLRQDNEAFFAVFYVMYHQKCPLFGASKRTAWKKSSRWPSRSSTLESEPAVFASFVGSTAP
jgi:5-methylcytosine-specific restriction endonuclease McrA